MLPAAYIHIGQIDRPFVTRFEEHHNDFKTNSGGGVNKNLLNICRKKITPSQLWKI